MASLRSYPDGFNKKFAVAVTVALVFYLIFVLPKISAAEGFGGNENLRQKKKSTVLGSKPPGCVNKCFSCRPCMATLVVPSDKKKGFITFTTFKKLSHGEDGDNGYYLLSWKCKCGDKLFQP